MLCESCQSGQVPDEIFFTKLSRLKFRIVLISRRIPLIQAVSEDDRILLGSPAGDRFRILNCFPWRDYREPAAQYHDALYDFNRSESRERVKEKEPGGPDESEEDAKLRLLSVRVAVDEDVPRLFTSRDSGHPPLRL